MTIINVNLLRDISQTNAPKKMFSFGASSAINAVSGVVMPAKDETSAFVNRGIIFVIPIIFALGTQKYQKIMSDDMLQNLQKEHAALQEKLKTFDPAVREVERFQEEKRKLNSQLEVIKQLSRERLKNVKSLDMLQQIIPAKAWLISLRVIEKKVEMEGIALDDIIISEFMQAMSQTIYFSNVTLVSSEEAKLSEGLVKKFKIKCNLENL